MTGWSADFVSRWTFYCPVIDWSFYEPKSGTRQPETRAWIVM